MNREERINIIKEDMANTKVNLLSGYTNLLHLCEKVGIKERIQYYNMVEKRVEKSLRSIDNDYYVVKQIHDYGFVFNNFFEIRHVTKAVFKLYSNIEIKEIRERI